MLITMLFLYIVGLFHSATALELKDCVGKLPALGWNSWNAFKCEITSSHIVTAAEKIVALGLKDAGYEYVNIDDCWQRKDMRDNATHRLIADPKRFPEGIKALSDTIHGLGLKIGIYSSAGTQTCAGYPASIGYETVDAATWAEWEIDYLKYDNCYIPQNWTDTCRGCVPEMRPDLVNGTCTNTTGLCPPDYDYTHSNTFRRFEIMRDALLAQSRPMLYSLCQWGEAGVQQWGNQTGSSWRMSGDIEPNWPKILSILNQNTFYLHNTNFWGHSDADMLEIGNEGVSLQEARTHFALWAAMKSPLLIGTDLAKVSQEIVEVLKNPYLLAFNQDNVFGKPAMPYKWGTNPDWTFNESFPAEYWAGQSKAGTLVLMFNPYNTTERKDAIWEEIPGLDANGTYVVTDVWTGEDLQCWKEGINRDVLAHDTTALLVGPSCDTVEDDYGVADPEQTVRGKTESR